VLLAGQCLAPTFMGDFHLKGAELRREGLNRIGNMLVPNSNYCAFEDWIMPIFEAMLREQQEQGTHWTPSSVRSSVSRSVQLSWVASSRFSSGPDRCLLCMLPRS
jgi:deoxyhypusine synthase